MNKSAERLEKLKTRKEQLEAQIQRLEAAEKTRERKRETRKKILVGAYYLEQAKETGQWEAIQQAMDGYLNRKIDRELFGLATKQQEITQSEETVL